MGRMGCAGGCGVRHRHLDGHAVGGRTVPAGTVVSHDVIGVAQAAEDVAVEEPGAFHRLDHTGAAAVLGSVDVVTCDAGASCGPPGQPYLTRLERGREGSR